MASHNQNRPLERISKILDFIEVSYKSNPDKETFLFGSGKMGSFNKLLEDGDLLEMAFKKIVDETKGNIKIEFRAGIPINMTVGDDYLHSELMIWFYVENQNKFREYQNLINQQIQKSGSVIRFILDAKDFFYQEDHYDKRHHFKPGSLRYRLIRFLAVRKDFVTTQDLSIEMKASADDVRGAIEEVRTIVARKMHLPRESIFENNLDGTGYRVTNIFVTEG